MQSGARGWRSSCGIDGARASFAIHAPGTSSLAASVAGRISSLFPISTPFGRHGNRNLLGRSIESDADLFAKVVPNRAIQHRCRRLARERGPRVALLSSMSCLKNRQRALMIGISDGVLESRYVRTSLELILVDIPAHAAGRAPKQRDFAARRSVILYWFPRRRAKRAPPRRATMRTHELPRRDNR